MKCMKHTLIIAIALFAAGLFAYFELPQFRGVITSAGPLLLILLCPLSMMLMMKGMSSDAEQKTPDSDKALTQDTEAKK